MSRKPPKGTGLKSPPPQRRSRQAAADPEARISGSPPASARPTSPEDGWKAVKRHLGLIEMGRIGEFAIRMVAAHIQAVIGVPVDILDPMEIPQAAFQPHRQQFDAGLVIKYLKEHLIVPQGRILALIAADLCDPILTYVYGEAEVGGKAAVVSTFRLSKNEDGTPTTRERYYERLAKVALHEVAHTFSLYHCDEPSCLMRFSPKLANLDQIRLAFCDRCDFVLRENVFERFLRPPEPQR